MSDNKFISLDEAVCRVGKARFAGEWIGELTDRESWLIKRYVTGAAKPEPHSSFISGRISYSIGSHTWAEFPVSPELRAEVERALDRHEHMQHQIEAAFDWLEKHGFDVDADTVSGEALAREFRKYGLAVPDVVAATSGETQPGPATNKPARMTRIDAQKACQKWLGEKMQASPQVRPMGKTKHCREAQKRFPALTRRGFQTAWEGALRDNPSAAERWSRPGPTPRSSH